MSADGAVKSAYSAEVKGSSDAATRVLTSSELLLHITSFQPGLKITEWTSGDMAVMCGHINLLRQIALYDTDQTASDVCSSASNNVFTQNSVRAPAVSNLFFTCAAMDEAAAQGSLETVRWLHEHTTVGGTLQSLIAASSNGHVDVLQYILDHECVKLDSWDRLYFTDAMDAAAVNGHLQILQLLHERGAGTCSTKAFVGAARHGHLIIVRWLHTNCPDKCTWRALPEAAIGGHLEVMKALYDVYGDMVGGYNFAAAVNKLAAEGDLAALQWLFETVPDLSTVSSASPIYTAATSGHLRLLQYLVQQLPDAWQSVHDIAGFAAVSGSLEIMEYIHSQGKEFPAVAAEVATRYGHLDLLTWLYECDNEIIGDKLFELAAASSSENALLVGRWVHGQLRRLNRPVNVSLDVFDSIAKSAHATEWLRMLSDLNNDFFLEHVHKIFSCKAELKLELVKWLEEDFEPSRGQKWLKEVAPESLELYKGSLRLCEYLRDHGLCESGLSNSWSWASAEGKIDVLTWLLATGIVAPLPAETLNNAAENGHLSLVQWLLRRNTQEFAGCSQDALVYPCKGGHTDILRSLLDHQYSLCSDRDAVKVALREAIERGHYRTAKFLLGQLRVFHGSTREVVRVLSRKLMEKLLGLAVSQTRGLELASAILWDYLLPEYVERQQARLRNAQNRQANPGPPPVIPPQERFDFAQQLMAEARDYIRDMFEQHNNVKVWGTLSAQTTALACYEWVERNTALFEQQIWEDPRLRGELTEVVYRFTPGVQTDSLHDIFRESDKSPLRDVLCFPFRVAYNYSLAKTMLRFREKPHYILEWMKNLSGKEEVQLETVRMVWEFNCGSGGPKQQDGYESKPAGYGLRGFYAYYVQRPPPVRLEAHLEGTMKENIKRGMEQAATSVGNSEVVRWIYEELRYDSNHQSVANDFAFKGDLTFLQWFVQKYRVKINGRSVLSHAIKGGHLHVFLWGLKVFFGLEHERRAKIPAPGGESRSQLLGDGKTIQEIGTKQNASRDATHGLPVSGTTFYTYVKKQSSKPISVETLRLWFQAAVENLRVGLMRWLWTQFEGELGEKCLRSSLHAVNAAISQLSVSSTQGSPSGQQYQCANMSLARRHELYTARDFLSTNLKNVTKDKPSHVINKPVVKRDQRKTQTTRGFAFQLHIPSNFTRLVALSVAVFVAARIVGRRRC